MTIEAKIAVTAGCICSLIIFMAWGNLEWSPKVMSRSDIECVGNNENYIKAGTYDELRDVRAWCNIDTESTSK